MARRFRNRVRVLAGFCDDSSSSYTYALLPVTECELRHWRSLILDVQQQQAATGRRLLHIAYSDYSPSFVVASAISAAWEDNAAYDYVWKPEGLLESQAWQLVLERGSRDQIARVDSCQLRVGSDYVCWQAVEKYCDNQLGTPSLHLDEINELLQHSWYYD